jgi:hypothetical protein
VDSRPRRALPVLGRELAGLGVGSGCYSLAGHDSRIILDLVRRHGVDVEGMTQETEDWARFMRRCGGSKGFSAVAFPQPESSAFLCGGPR